jgi:hypothetical protein
MPTPFMHLHIAEQVRASDGLNGAVGRLLAQEWPACYLGSVAADVQVISQAPREQTHFYGLPPDPQQLPYEVMLERHPELANAGRLPSAQAVFVAAYTAHLLLDVRWYWEVLVPYFISAEWGETRYRFLIHNTLLTYLDQIALAALPATAGATLAAAEPANWLPFAADADLVQWRDMLVAQMQPGAAVQTVEIYAKRLGMTAADFAANLRDPAWLEAQVFSNIPLPRVQAVLDGAVGQSIELIEKYLMRDA